MKRGTGAGPGLTRRGLMCSGALAAFASAPMPRFLLRAAGAAETSKRRVLVAVFLRGAADGLSMVVPHGERAYYAGRPSIAVAPPAAATSDGAIDLDGFFGLHPAAAQLIPLWEARALAVVHACGSPAATRSHFDAQDYMESGTPGVKSTPDGWLARGLALTERGPSSPFRAVALAPQVPRSLRGGAGAVAMRNIADFDVRGGGATAPAGSMDARRGFEALYARGGRDLLHSTGGETFDAVAMLKAADPARLTPAHGAEYPRGRFGESLRQIAQLVRAELGLEVAFADIAGWDTHAGQGAERGPFANRMAELAGGLAAFARDLGDRMSDVVVLTMTEFGRTVSENGNRGTDHGRGAAMLVLGGPVRGGVVRGRWPGLAPEQLFEGRDLAVTTDFRNLFGEVAVRHLGVPLSAPLFPGFRLSAHAFPGVIA
jgi:uncharacterized protein (DUF1501 family)